MILQIIYLVKKYFGCTLLGILMFLLRITLRILKTNNKGNKKNIILKFILQVSKENVTILPVTLHSAPSPNKKY